MGTMGQVFTSAVNTPPLLSLTVLVPHSAGVLVLPWKTRALRKSLEGYQLKSDTLYVWSGIDTEKLEAEGVAPLPHCTLLKVTWAFFTVTEYRIKFKGRFRV